MNTYFGDIGYGCEGTSMYTGRDASRDNINSGSWNKADRHRVCCQDTSAPQL